MTKHRGSLATNPQALARHEAAYYRRADGKKRPRQEAGQVQTIAAPVAQPAADIPKRSADGGELPPDPAGANSEDWI